MISKLTEIALNRRYVVLALAILANIFGYQCFKALPIEAYPDIADTLVDVITQYPGRAAEEIEKQVTIPVERQLNGVPGVTVMRSKSVFGLSLVTLIFKDGTDDYFARQRVLERLGQVTLPNNVTPVLAPLTSPIGEIYRYILVGNGDDPMDLRTLNSWVVVPYLKQVPGVEDVNVFGGLTREYQVVVDPEKMAHYNVTLAQVTAALQGNNANTGGSFIERGDFSLIVRGIGQIQTTDDIANVVVTAQNRTPLYVRDILYAPAGEPKATARIGAFPRNGIFGINDRPDAVSGIVLLRRGENPSKVLEGVHRMVEHLNSTVLPRGVRLIPYYDRTEVIGNTVSTVARTLSEGLTLVAVVLILLLGNVRAAIIVALTIPFSLLFAFACMERLGVPANLISLGAIDFGIIVDGAIVMVENIIRRCGTDRTDRGLLDVARDAMHEVERPLFFSATIIMTAYLPLFAFERIERKLFTPMAITVAFAMLGALIMALLLAPPILTIVYRRRVEDWENPALVIVRRGYIWLLGHFVRMRVLVLGVATGLIVFSLFVGALIGREFLPYLDEGSLWVQISLPAGVNLGEAKKIADRYREIVNGFQEEVTCVTTQLGRNDDGTDPWAFNHIESYVGLKHYSLWPPRETKPQLVERMRKRIRDSIPGIDFDFSQPMIDGVNDKVGGAHSPIVLKVFGDDLDELYRLADRAMEALEGVPGATGIALDQDRAIPQVHIVTDRPAIARYAVNASDVNAIVDTAIGGQSVTQVIDGDRSFGLSVRYAEPTRDSVEKLRSILVSAPQGVKVPLGQLAEIAVKPGAAVISRERNRRHLTIKCSVEGRDQDGFVAEARVAVDKALTPRSSAIELVWGGQFENQERAQARMRVIVPMTLAIIFLLLFAAFGTVKHALLILSNVPFALVGGILALYLRDIHLSVSAAVGFIALFGVAVQNGVVLVAHLNELREARPDLSLDEAIVRGAKERFRATVLMAGVAMLGLIPAALATGVGSDVQRPLATVVVGGLLSSTLLTLFVLPPLYRLFERDTRSDA
jgi:cobalt-zinc-cadmium resistance protein CzcA